MLNSIRELLRPEDDAAHGHAHGHEEAHHGHTHGVIDPSIATTERGIWAIKWSFVILAITAALQICVVLATGSIALLADTIHNVADATTAIPLWIAFRLAQRKPTATFTYGYGRVEDLAGVAIVSVILFSALVAGYQSIERILHPQPVEGLGWVTLAGLIGFLGNEAVAIFRIRIGREINSAALIADGYHARTDGLTSLAVVAGALGVWLGFPLADPIVGLLITIAILGIVWQSAKAVLVRMLDGVDPTVTNEIRHAATHVAGVRRILDVKARWLGHQLHADLAVLVDGGLTIAEGDRIAEALKAEMKAHIPTLSAANVRFHGREVISMGEHSTAHAVHHHAPKPFEFTARLAQGVLAIVGTPQGERMRLMLSRPAGQLKATVSIDRPGGIETLVLSPDAKDPGVLQSAEAPAEPHEFTARLYLSRLEAEEVLSFKMTEPADHHH